MLEILTELRRCPICGSKAFLSHDVVDGYDFGYSVGCPRACINDGIHGFNDSESFKNAQLVFHGFLRKEDAINTWNKRAEC